MLLALGPLHYRNWRVSFFERANGRIVLIRTFGFDGSSF